MRCRKVYDPCRSGECAEAREKYAKGQISRIDLLERLCGFHSQQEAARLRRMIAA